jgi:hypothetical protein
LAAGLPDAYLASSGRWLIVGAGLLAAVANEVLGGMKVREMEDLRECGRIEAARIAAYAHQRIPEVSNDPEKLSAVKSEIRELIHRLELDQHRSATSIGAAAPPAKP